MTNKITIKQETIIHARMDYMASFGKEWNNEKVQEWITETIYMVNTE